MTAAVIASSCDQTPSVHGQWCWQVLVSETMAMLGCFRLPSDMCGLDACRTAIMQLCWVCPQCQLTSLPPVCCCSHWIWVTLSLKEKELLATAGMDALVSSYALSSSTQQQTMCLVVMVQSAHSCHLPQRLLHHYIAAANCCSMHLSAVTERHFCCLVCLQMFERLIVFGLQLMAPVTILSCAVCE